MVDEYLGTDVPRYDDAFTSSVAPGTFEDDEFENDTCWDCGDPDCTCGEDDGENCDHCGEYLNECTCERSDYDLATEGQNLFSKPVEAETTQHTNPVTRARLRSGLTATEVAEALGLPVKTYLSRVEVEGRFFKPSTVGRILHQIEMLAKEV